MNGLAIEIFSECTFKSLHTLCLAWEKENKVNTQYILEGHRFLQWFALGGFYHFSFSTVNKKITHNADQEVGLNH